MSGRAAWRLESLGFAEVYRYHDGKSDWIASALPSEGEHAHEARIDDVAHRGVPTCAIDDQVAIVRSRLEETGYELCVVVNQRRVVFGSVRAKKLAKADGDALIEDVMDPAPSTYRPHVTVDELTEHLKKAHARDALVSTADGVLIGLVRLKELEKFHGPYLAANGRSWKSA